MIFCGKKAIKVVPETIMSINIGVPVHALLTVYEGHFYHAPCTGSVHTA